MTIHDGFSFKTDELSIYLNGFRLDLCGTFTVSCDGDGLIQGIGSEGGFLLDNPYDIDRTRRALFSAFEAAILEKCHGIIAEHVADTRNRVKGRAADRAYEASI